jgi:hypothetical protein
VAAKIAFVTAATMADAPASPIPPVDVDAMLLTVYRDRENHVSLRVGIGRQSALTSTPCGDSSAGVHCVIARLCDRLAFSGTDAGIVLDLPLA